jgi:ssDNA-binding Zn-finger/Zn-ribbon topoisomerase 1
MKTPIFPENNEPETLGISCPECHSGQLSARTSLYGKIFYYCNQYPTCNYSSWKRPIDQTCVTCGYPIHYQGKLDNFEYYICGRDGCDEWIYSLDAEGITNPVIKSMTIENGGHL